MFEQEKFHENLMEIVQQSDATVEELQQKQQVRFFDLDINLAKNA